MIKKIGKVMILAIMALLFFTLPTFAREMKVEELEKYIDNNEKYSSVRTLYIIGNYIFTSDYDVNTKDIMLGATSISLDPTSDGDENQRYVNGTGAYNKMEIFQINRIISGGEAKGWNIADSYVKGSTTLTKDMKINVKFIDYEYVKDMYTITFKDSEGSNPDKIVSVLEGDKVTAPTEGFTRDGYKLMGWYTTNPETLFDFNNTPITENMELHAKWSELPKASLTDFPDTIGIYDEAKEFGVKMEQSNDFKNKMVYGHFSITRNGEDARSLAEIQYYETGNGVNDWLTLEGNDFGPKDTGFPVIENLESKFKVSFKEVGTYHIVIEVRDKATDEAYITIEKDIVVSPVEVDTDSIVGKAEEKLTETFFTSTYAEQNINIKINDVTKKLDEVKGTGVLEALGVIAQEKGIIKITVSDDANHELVYDKGVSNVKYDRAWVETFIKTILNKESTEEITLKDLADKTFTVTIELSKNAVLKENAHQTYTVKFTADQYTVTFKPDGENNKFEEKVYVGEKATKPEQTPTKDGYVFKFWAEQGKEEEYKFDTTVEGDLVLEAKYKVIVDISQLLKEAASSIIVNENYGAEFNDGTLIFNIKNKAAKNSDISSTGLIGNIVGLLRNVNVTTLKVTCKGVEGPNNYAEFTKSMVGSGSGPESQAWLKFQDLLKTATGKDNFDDITLGDLVNCGDMGLEVTLDADKAVAKDDKTTFDIKFVELVQPKELAGSVVTLLEQGEGYTAVYNEKDGKRTVEIKMDNPQEELKNVEGSNMLVALGNMLNDNVSSLTLAIKNGDGAAKNVLTANREGLASKEYTHKWLEDKLLAEGITTNKDLLNKEFIVTVNLDENAKVSGTGGKILIYNIVFTADTCTVTFKNGEEQTTKEVLKGETVTAPETNPTKKGYEFQFWAKDEEETAFEFDKTPVTEDLTLNAVFKVDVETDKLVKNAVSGIVGKGFTAKYEAGKVTIDITEIDKQISDIKDTRIMIVLGEILKTEGVKSVKVTYDDTSADYEAIEEEPNYDEMKTKLQTVLTKIGATDLYGLVDKELKVTIEVADEAILKATDVQAEEKTAEYTINFTSDYVRATDKTSLEKAIQGEKGHIVIENSFEVENDIEINRNVTILSSKEENTITRKGEGEDTHVFKITGNANVTLEGLKLKGATSAAVLVEANATVTANDLKVEDENYNKPAIAVKTGGTVKSANKFTRVDTPYKVIENGESDSLTEIKDTTNYYIDELHSKLYKITFNLVNGTAFRFCMYNEVPQTPKSKEKPYDSIERGIRYTFANQWKVNSGAELTGNVLSPATSDTIYTAQYTTTDFKKVTDKNTLVKAISEISDGLPIIIEANGEIDIDNLKINTDKSVTLIGKGNVTLKGTITATNQVPSLSLHKLKIVGDGTGNEATDGKYYIIKSEAKKFTLWQSTVSNEADSSKQAYSAVYLPVDGIVANIRFNTFDADNIYNTIQFGPGKAVGSGTIISNNTFKGKENTHNHINIYTVQEGAKIAIERNTFEYSGNAIRLSNTTNASAEFTISNNTYNETDSTNENKYAGFIIMQIAGGNDDFKNFKITSIDNKGPEGKILTAESEDNAHRFVYYASADGNQVGNDNTAGSDKNATITFKNTKS